MIVLAIALFLTSGQDVAASEAAVRKNPNASTYRALADAYVDARQFDRASAAFFKASSLYLKLGDENAAKVLQTQGERYETKIDIFYERPASPQAGARAPLEPATGCYLGAFIDREDAIDGTFVGNGQLHRHPNDFNRAVGKKHAVFFTYLGYGRPFPITWVSALRQSGAAAHIAWEPRSMSSVRDDDYLNGFARACAASGVPIFLRFAGEMNGDWTPYHDDPERYKQMFATVARVMHRTAPNVAMVWCPNEVPETQIASYYPGAQYVDWVGVNFYSVLFNDANRTRGAEWRNPADSIRFVYNTYSKTHPIMIGEWAATHLSVVDNAPRPDFAVNKIGQLYAALPRLFPRVKAVHWLSMDTIKHAIPGRQLNDYSLLEEPKIAEKYRSMVSNSYFVEEVGLRGENASPIEYVKVTDNTVLSGKVKLSLVVKTYDQRPAVIWNVNGEPSSPKTEPGAYEVSLDTKRLGGTSAKISILVNDSSGHLAGKKEVAVRLQN